MKELTKDKIYNRIFRIFSCIIFSVFIEIIAFTSLIFSFDKMVELGKLDLAVSFKFLIFSIAIMYLRIANVLYWFFDINLFDIKKLEEFNEKEVKE